MEDDVIGSQGHYILDRMLVLGEDNELPIATSRENSSSQLAGYLVERIGYSAPIRASKHLRLDMMTGVHPEE